MLEESKCWRVSGVRAAEAFFRAASLLVPDATHMFLEGAPDPDIEVLLADAADETDYAAPLLVSKSVPRERVERFASAVGGAVSDGAA
jgi:hypothetical protein